MSTTKSLREQIEEKMKELVSKYLSEIEKDIARFHSELLEKINRIREQVR